MSIFTEPTPATAFLKAGFLGFQGSGKTYTAAMVMIGLVEYLRTMERAEADRPVYFMDTETGFDYVKRHFDRHGIKTRIARTRAFSDLKPAIQEAESEGVGLLIDSVTHYWTEFMQAYMRKTKRRFIQFEDWRYLKQEWNDDFATLYVNSRLHFIVAGRAGYEYDYHEREDGKKELEKTGIRMKTEGEFGYEPSLLVMMDRNVDPDTKKVTRQAHVLKERFSVIDGQTFTFESPADVDTDTCRETFRAFFPHIKLLNIGGAHVGVDTSRKSDDAIPEQGANDWANEQRQRGILAEEISGILQAHFPGQTNEHKQARLALMQEFFGTRSWKKIEEATHSKDLRAGLEKIKAKLEPKAEVEIDIDQVISDINGAEDRELAQLALDTARGHPREVEATAAFNAKWAEAA